MSDGRKDLIVACIMGIFVMCPIILVILFVLVVIQEACSP